MIKEGNDAGHERCRGRGAAHSGNLLGSSRGIYIGSLAIADLSADWIEAEVVAVGGKEADVRNVTDAVRGNSGS